MPILVKLVATVILVLAISEIAKKNAQLGAFIIALPWLSLLTIFWLRFDHTSPARIAEYSSYTFWYVLATLPMFPVFSVLLKAGVAFWPAAGGAVIVGLLSLITVSWVAARFGFPLF